MSAIDTSPDQRLADEPTQGGGQLSCDLESLPGPSRPVTVLSVTGEIDTCTQVSAETALAAALDHAPGPVVVDLAGLTFCSAGGLGLFAAPAGTASGHDYVLAGMTPHLQRVAAVLWPVDGPVRYPHAAAAVTALRAAQVSASAGARSAAPDRVRRDGQQEVYGW